jgi:hypothetical protein
MFEVSNDGLSTSMMRDGKHESRERENFVFEMAKVVKIFFF